MGLFNEKRSTKMRRDYKNKFGISYIGSSRKFKCSVPDKIKFPSQYGWVWVRDCSTVVLSPDKPKSVRGAVRVLLGRTKNLQGCRVFTSDEVSHGVGEPFRMCDTMHSREGERFLIEIPDPDKRLPPKQRFADRTPVSAPEPEPEPAEPGMVFTEEDHETVTVSGYGSEWKFKLTVEELLKLTSVASEMSHDA